MLQPDLFCDRVETGSVDLLAEEFQEDDEDFLELGQDGVVVDRFIDPVPLYDFKEGMHE